jgi:hypothetical protein
MSESAFFLRRMNDHVQYLCKIKDTLEEKGDFHGTDHHSCKLGRWLDNEGPEQSSAVGAEARKVFDQLIAPHEQFHRASGQALECKAAGDPEGMEDAMTEMFKLSNTMVNMLIQLDGMYY